VISLSINSTDGVTADDVPYEKTFWYPSHFKATWVEAKTICNSFGMDFLTLSSLDESKHFLKLYEEYVNLFDLYTHIGAAATVAKSTTDWYWVENREKVNFTMRFLPGTPDNAGGNEMCLTLTHVGGYNYFNDLKCYETYILRFICETVKFFSPTSKFSGL
jgi:hypothetical protein